MLRTNTRIIAARQARSDRTMKLVGRYHALSRLKAFGGVLRLMPKRPKGLGYHRRLILSIPIRDCPRCLTRLRPIRTGSRGLMRSVAMHTIVRMDR